MLGWSLKLFRIRGIQLAVHSSFFLLLAYVAWKGWDPGVDSGEAGGWHGAVWYTSMFLLFFTCVVLHELGHSLTAMRFGIGVRRILLMPIGGMAEFDSIPREPRRELLITLAGPAVNFVIAAAVWYTVRDLPDEAAAPGFSYGSFAINLMYWNLTMGCFNLLPAFPMDGGRILRALLASRRPYLQATRWAASIGKVICVIGVIAAILVSSFKIASLWLLAVLFVFIYVAGELEYRAAERRERDDAHWREVLSRIYGPQDPASEPPLLSP